MRGQRGGESTGGRDGQPTPATGTSMGGGAPTGESRMLSKLEPIKVWLRDAVTAVNQVNRGDLDACKDVKRRLVPVCNDLDAQLKGNAVAEKLSDAIWKTHYNKLTVDAREATIMVENLISKMYAKCLQEHAAVVLNTVSRAVEISLGSVGY
jgi:hypothetical protein